MKKIVQKKKTTTKMIVEDISEAEHREHKMHFFLKIKWLQYLYETDLSLICESYYYANIYKSIRVVLIS